MRVCLRDKQRRVSGLARPWRVPALVGALDADPETIPDLLVSAQRFFFGHPFATTSYTAITDQIQPTKGRRTATDPTMASP